MKRNSTAQAILNAFKKRKTLTDPQIAEITGIHENTVRPSRQDLEQRGIIVKTEYIRDRSGKTIKSVQYRTKGHYRVYKLVEKEDVNDITHTLKKVMTLINQAMKELEKTK